MAKFKAQFIVGFNMSPISASSPSLRQDKAMFFEGADGTTVVWSAYDTIIAMRDADQSKRRDQAAHDDSGTVAV